MREITLSLALLVLFGSLFTPTATAADDGMSLCQKLLSMRLLTTPQGRLLGYIQPTEFRDQYLQKSVKVYKTRQGKLYAIPRKHYADGFENFDMYNLAMRFPKWANRNGFFAHRGWLYFWDVEVLNAMYEELKDTPFRKTLRFEAFGRGGTTNVDEVYSAAQSVSALAQRRIIVASDFVYFMHDRITEHIAAAIFMPNVVFERLAQRALFIKSFGNAIPMIAKNAVEISILRAAEKVAEYILGNEWENGTANIGYSINTYATAEPGIEKEKLLESTLPPLRALAGANSANAFESLINLILAKATEAGMLTSDLQKALEDLAATIPLDPLSEEDLRNAILFEIEQLR